MLLVLFCIAFVLYRSRSIIHEATEPSKAAQAVLVTTYLVQSAPFSETIQTNAQIQSDNAVALHPKIAGYITEIYVHEGQQVTTGQPLITLDHATDQDDLAQKKAAVNLAKTNYDRALTIQQSGAISKEAIEKLQATYLSNAAAYQQSYDILKDKLITSPIHGTVGTLNLTVGDYVTSSNTLTTITDLDHLKAYYSLGAHFYNFTHLNDLVTLTSMVNKHHSMTATISYISPTLNANTQTFSIHTLFENKNQTFSPGETATVTQTIAKNPNGITIPLEAVMTSLEDNHVYIIKNGHAVSQPVILGLAHDSTVQVLQGLKSGDRIILSTLQVHDGSAVDFQ